QANAKAGNYESPDELFYGFLSKVASFRESPAKRMGTTENFDLQPSTSGQLTFRCILCKKVGHKARHCLLRRSNQATSSSTPRSSDQGIRCPRCGKKGHTEQLCWSRVKPTCSSCGKMGHKDQDCWKRPSLTSTCTTCGKRGHLAENCWTKERGKPKDVRILQRQVPNSFYNIAIEINGQHFNGYIDTGSQLNVANIRVANKLNLKLYPTDIILRNFSGSHIVPEGTSQGRNTNQKEVSRKVGYQKFGRPYKIKKVLGNDRYEITSLEGLKGYKRFRAIVSADSLREWKGGVVDIRESESEVNSTDELIDLFRRRSEAKTKLGRGIPSLTQGALSVGIQQTEMKISHEDTIPRQLTSASETSAANDDAISTVQHAPKKRNTIKTQIKNDLSHSCTIVKLKSATYQTPNYGVHSPSEENEQIFIHRKTENELATNYT
ncbi:unnamed protein product, partial [Acanthoscelides obtectus]